MMRFRPLLTSAAIACLAAAPGLALLAGAASAAELVGSYRAYIGQPDLVNSAGKRLDTVWQVLRQDRANVHRYRIRQPGDESDPFFSDAGNRAALEQMLRRNPPDRATAAAILRGDVLVEVQLLGAAGRADSVRVRLLP